MRYVKNKKMLFLASITILASLLIFIFYNRLNSGSNLKLKNFLRNNNFLSSSDEAIEFYDEAVAIFKKNGVNKVNFETYMSSDSFAIPENEIQKAKTAIKNGLLCKKLGIKLQGLLNSEIVMPSGKKFDFVDLILLSKAIKLYSYREMLQKENNYEIDFWLKANIALGAQLLEYKDKSIQLCGLACARQGFEDIKDYAKSTGDNRLFSEADKMINKIKEQGKVVYNTPDEFPLF